jgi:AcrR family transcriptional regulator
MRQEIVAIARERFLADGYAATTVSAIAQTAGVSVETVYKAFGNKAGLARAVFDRALAGEGPVSTGERAAIVKRDEHDPRRRLRAFGGFVGEVTPRVAPVRLVLRAAAETDPEAAAIWRRINDERLAGMRRDAEQLASEGALRTGVTAAEAADVFWSFTSPELYDLFVVGRGWTPERFGAWVGETFVAVLLRPASSASTPRSS